MRAEKDELFERNATESTIAVRVKIRLVRNVTPHVFAVAVGTASKFNELTNVLEDTASGVKTLVEGVAFRFGLNNTSNGEKLSQIR